MLLDRPAATRRAPAQYSRRICPKLDNCLNIVRPAEFAPALSRLQRRGPTIKLGAMTAQLPLLVFTDLDGTLLCHETYSWTDARPALSALKRTGAGVVLASSKTAPEMAPLRADMGLTEWPAIVENGSGILPPQTLGTAQASEYEAIRAALDNLPTEMREKFLGFGDMSVAQVCDATGLPAADAALARRRSYSEPGLWRGSDDERTIFMDALARNRITAREGGRFLTLSFGQTKADRMAEITAQYAPRHTIALGDAPNDVEMLEAADYAVIVGNPHHTPLPLLQGEPSDRVIRTQRPGPEGWNAAVLELIGRLQLDKGEHGDG